MCESIYATTCISSGVVATAAINTALSQKDETRNPSMGWLRVVDSLKLQVSFAEYSLFYRALLQKRPEILRSLLLEATSYI